MAPRTLPGSSQAGLTKGARGPRVVMTSERNSLYEQQVSKCLAKLGRPAERTVTNVKSIPRNAHSYRDLEDAFRQANKGTNMLFVS